MGLSAFRGVTLPGIVSAVVKNADRGRYPGISKIITEKVPEITRKQPPAGCQPPPTQNRVQSTLGRLQQYSDARIEYVHGCAVAEPMTE